MRTAAVLVALCLPAALRAGPLEESEALVRQGNDLRKAGDDEGALPLFRKAFEIHRTPRTTAQLGLVELSLHRWVEADEHLTESFKAVQTDTWIRNNRNTIEEALRIAKRNVGRVEITGDPAGAEVLVNGRPVGKIPLAQPVRVMAGTVDIELRAPGYRNGIRTISVAGLQYQPIVIRLEKEGEPPRTAAGEPTPVQRPATASPGGPESDLVATAGMPTWRKTAIGVALGATGLSLAVAGYSIWRHNGRVDDFNGRRCLETANGAILAATRTADSRCASLKTQYESAWGMAILGASAAGALGASALILYLTNGSGSPRPQAASAGRRLACAPDLGRSGLLCQLVF